MYWCLRKSQMVSMMLLILVRSFWASVLSLPGERVTFAMSINTREPQHDFLRIPKWDKLTRFLVAVFLYRSTTQALT